MIAESRSDVVCPHCLFSGGRAALGLNLCRDCGGWFEVRPTGHLVSLSSPDDATFAGDGGRDAWSPEPVELRAGEAPDRDSHAHINAALRRQARNQ